MPYRQGYLDAFRSINDTLLIALNGTDFFASEKIACDGCSTTRLKNGKPLHRHIAVTPVLVAPGQTNAIPLPQEFVQPQDGHDKQDCERAVAARWLTRWGALLPVGLLSQASKTGAGTLDWNTNKSSTIRATAAG